MKTTHPIILLCMAAILGGCGGGGGGGSTPAVPKTWGTGVLIETSAGGVGHARPAFDAAGNALVVWEQLDGTHISIWSNRYDAATKRWGTAAPIEQGDAGRARTPQLAVDPFGNAIAVWVQDDGTTDRVMFNRFNAASGTWGTVGPGVALPIDDGSGDTLEPEIAFDASGNALAIWAQRGATRFDIRARRYVAGSGWAATVDLLETNDNGDAGGPEIAFDPSGHAVAVWYQHDGTARNAVSNRYTAGVGWGTAVLIETDSGDALYPQVAVDVAGNAIAVWMQSDGTRRNIVANRYSAGGAWGATAVTIETENGGSAFDPYVVVDGSGNAIAAWTQSDGTRSSAWANRYTAGVGWASAEKLEQDDIHSTNNLHLAIDNAGNVVAVWEQDDPNFARIQSNRYTAGVGWNAAPTPIDNNSGDAYTPRIGFDRFGRALVLWEQSDGDFSLYANRYE